MDKKHIDLLVVGGGWDIGAGNQPALTDNSHSIGQDIKHAIMESGLARELQGQRSLAKRAEVLTRIELLVEDDDRIVPGTARCNEETPSRYFLTATTKEFGDIKAGMNL